jgi:maltose alpha-D-glucosyltransferase/alpha-amylase
MQWTSYGGGGFSELPREQWVRQPPGGAFAPEFVNVGEQRGQSGSLLNWMTELIRTRRECGEIGTGEWKLIDLGADAVLGLRYEVPGSVLITVNNLSPEKCQIDLRLSPTEREEVTVMLADARYPLDDRGGFSVNAYGYLWLRVGGIY